MLFQLGVITIASPGPFNATDVSEDFGSDFAVKPVVGALQPREFMGEADNHMTITGTLFPYRYASWGQATGLDEVEMLRAITGSGDPQPVVRGDGKNLGSWLVEKVSVKSTKLSADGIGRVFARDLAPFEAAVAACVPASLPHNAFDACVSLAFNIGAHGFKGSTVVHKIAAGDMPAAADAFLMWVHPPELASRRRAERAQFLTPDASATAPAAKPPVLQPGDAVHITKQPGPPAAGLGARLRFLLTGRP